MGISGMMLGTLTLTFDGWLPILVGWAMACGLCTHASGSTPLASYFVVIVAAHMCKAVLTSIRL